MRHKKDYYILLVCLALASASYAIQTNTLPLYLLILGGNEVHVGMMAGLSSVISMFFRPFVGRIIDRVGRLPVYFCGLAFYGLASLGYVGAGSVTMLLAARAFYGIGMSATSCVIGNIAADLMPDRVSFALQTVNVTQTAGSLFAPTVGIWMAGAFGYRPLYSTTSVLFFTTMLLSLLITYERKDPIFKQMRSQRKPDKQSFFEKTALIPSLCMSFHGVAQVSMSGFVASYASTIGIDNIGFFFIINGIVTFLLRPVLARLSERKYVSPLFLAGCIGFGVSHFLFIFARSALPLAIAAIFYTVGYATTQPILNTLAMEKAPAERKGAANATYYLFWDFGYGLGSIMLGAVAEKFGYGNMFLVGFAALLVMFTIYRLHYGKIFAGFRKTQVSAND